MWDLIRGAPPTFTWFSGIQRGIAFAKGDGNSLKIHQRTKFSRTKVMKFWPDDESFVQKHTLK